MLLFIIHFVRQKYFENGLSQQLFCICLKYPSLVILFLTVLSINVKASGVIFLLYTKMLCVILSLTKDLYHQEFQTLSLK